MRAVRGSVATSKPVSLSKASAILSRFVAEAVASKDAVAYLRRASAAFENLLHVHRDLTSSRGDLERESKKETKEKRRKKSERLEAEVEQLGNGEVLGGEDAVDARRKRKEKKNKKRSREDEEIGGVSDGNKENRLVVDDQSERHNKKKRRKILTEG